MKLVKRTPQVFFFYFLFLFCLPTTLLHSQSKGQITASPGSFNITVDISDKNPVLRDVIITNSGTEGLDVYVTSRKKALALPSGLSSMAPQTKKSRVKTEKPSEPIFRRHGKRGLQAMQSANALLGVSSYQTHGTTLFAGTADPKIVELDPQDGNELRTVALPESFTFFNDVAYDGTTLYYSDLFGISRFDAATGVKLDEIDIQSIFSDFPFLYDLATDGQYLYTTTGDQQIFKIDFDGRKVVGTIPISFFPGEGLAHGGNRGTFFSTDITSTHIYEVDITTGATVNTIDIGDTHYFTSLTYSSTANVLFAYDEFDNPAIFVLDPQTGEALNIIPTDVTKYYGAGLGADESYPGVFVTDRGTKTLAPGETITIPIEFSARELLADTYEYEVIAITDDPAHPDAIIPATLNVIGGQPPKFVADQTQLNFGSVYVTQNKKLKLKITNPSVDAVLKINSISTSSDRFTVDKATLKLNPTLDNSIEVTFTPLDPGNADALLRLETNDPNQAVVEIPLHALAVAPPVIQTDKNNIALTLTPGQSQTVSVTISNAGNSVLSWSAGLESKDASLEPILKRLNEGGSDRITSKIPSRYDFAGGKNGSSISGVDEPDLYNPGGNTIFAIDFDRVKIMTYTNGVIRREDILGGNGIIDDGKYFTTKHTGLFSFVADTDLNEFDVTGSLSGKQSTVDGADLKTTQRGIAFHGFVRRVYGPGALSLNHLFIIQDRASGKHEFSLNANLDNDNAFQSGFDLGSIHRVYYLLFASRSGTYVNDQAMTNIMNEFLRTVAYPEWGNLVSSSLGNVDPGQSNNLQIKFDVSGLSPGQYQTVLRIVSNDPNNSEIQIPVTLTVNNANNDAPEIIAPIPSRVISRKEEFTIGLSEYFRDPDGEALTYSIQASPAGNVAIVQVDAGSYKITGQTLGMTTVTITASDPSGASVAQPFDIKILNRDPILVSPIEQPAISVNEEITVDLGAHFSDPDDDPLTIVAQQLSIGLIDLGPVIDNKVKIKGKSPGIAGIILSILDPSGVSAKHANIGNIFHVQVNPNHAPTLVSPLPERSILLDQEITIDLAEHFADSDGDILTITATSATDFIDILLLSDNKLKIKGIAQGNAPIVVTVKDPFGATIIQTFHIGVVLNNYAPVVSSPIPEKTIFVAEEISINLSEHFTDADGDVLVYTATTNIPENISLRIDANFLYVKGKVAGHQTVTITATDPLQTIATLEFPVTVNVPENNKPISIASIPDKNIVVGQEFTLHLSENFSDPDQEALTYSVSLLDATVADGIVNLDQLRIIARKAGTTTVSVTATDPHAASATLVFNLSSRNDVVLQVTKNEGIPYSFSPNPFTETIRYSISIPENAYVRLSLIDPLGKVVMTPMDGLYSGGEITESIRLVDCAPGIYYYSLHINESIFSGKLVKYNR